MKKITLIALLCAICVAGFSQQKKNTKPELSDREYWVQMIHKISYPVLSNMSKGELVKNMKVEFAPTWDSRDNRVAYMETFGRLMAGISPWLALPDDGTPEGKLRAQIREMAIKSYINAVDPKSPDFLLWEGKSSQILVDAAFLVQSFMRAPSLWEALPDQTKAQYIDRFKRLRVINPAYSNWLLFAAMPEVFLRSIGEQAEPVRIEFAIRKMEEWYLGDGWYSDGVEFSMDYYNSYVIQPMYVEILESLGRKPAFDLALRRMERYNNFLERFISPEGSFPAFGRSMTYRMGAFQPLALSAWKYGLPKNMTNGQVRAALTTVMKRMFAIEGNFNPEGFLQLGFAGHQPNIADSYTNSGSLYLTSLVFMPLGLPADNDFWVAPAEEWTQQKAWSGQPFAKDYHQSIKTIVK